MDTHSDSLKQDTLLWSTEKRRRRRSIFIGQDNAIVEHIEMSMF
jgi:hypothetical protein